jgi:hypothetical protein
VSPEIVLDNAAMDIEQGDSISPNPDGSGLVSILADRFAAPRSAIPSTDAEVLVAVERKRKR